MEPDDKQLGEALKIESAEISGRIQEVYKSVYTLFGAVLPAILTVFGLMLKDATGTYRSDIAFVFILAVSVASLWGSSLWMEALSFLRYRYGVLQPRWYKATGQLGQPDIASFSQSGQPLRWLPSSLLNLILLLLMLVIWWNYIPFNELGKCWIALFCIVSAAIAFVAVHVERQRYQTLINARPQPKLG